MAENEAPSWIDAAFVQEALRRGGEEDTVVKSVTLSPLGAAGDHYASAMFRVTAVTASGERTVIVKSPPPGELMQKVVDETRVFPAESLLLSQLIPQMQALLVAVAPGKYPPLAAKCLHYGKEPEDFLVLEDLAPQGFRLADRHLGLGLRHALLAVRTLARFHAASVVLLSQDPSLPERLSNPFRANNDSFRLFVESSIEGVAKACRKWSDSPLSDYADSIAALKDTAYERYAAINDYRPDRFNVIVHGDFWLNNMMFLYENGEIKDLRLVDLQQSHVTTPAVDILYFVYSSVSEDVSRNQTDMLIREYHHSLKETMELLGFEAPSLAALLRDIEENAFYSTIAAFGVLPVVKTEKVPDLEKSFNKDVSGENDYMYGTPTMQRWLSRLIPQMAAKGLLQP